MDAIDRKILLALQEDSTLSLAAVAEHVCLSPTPCWNRIKRLENQGYITKRVALINAEKVGLGVSVFVHIKTRQHSSGWLKDFASTINAFPEVAECYRMSGEYDYLLRVVTSDIQSFDQFYKKLVNSMDGLSDVTSSFAMEQMKYTTALPL